MFFRYNCILYHKFGFYFYKKCYFLNSFDQNVRYSHLHICDHYATFSVSVSAFFLQKTSTTNNNDMISVDLIKRYSLF